MTQETKEWYDLAVLDLGVAKHLESTYQPKPYEIICYHCQQAAEKGIKALIMYYGLSKVNYWCINWEMSWVLCWG